MLNTPGDLIKKAALSSLKPGSTARKNQAGIEWSIDFFMCGQPITNRMEDVDKYEAALKAMALFVI
jgi:hypothetical protein